MSITSHCSSIKAIICRLYIDSGELTKAELKLTQKLNNWIKNTPLYLQLQWFDTVEQVKISSKLRNRRWNTEVTACDALYLEKMGIKLS